MQVHYETMTTPLPELIDEAVTASRLLRSADEYEAVWVPLRKAAEAGAAAIDTGLEMLGSGDPVIRATGCDLLGTVFNGSDEPRRAVAAALVELAGRESDPDVLWSVAGALHFASDPIAIPILIGLAAHPDSNVRFQTAHALTSAMADHPNDKGVEALLRLTADRDPEVRNWATFGLGRQMEIDGPEIRDALWARVGDSYEDVRVEGICGLARRHDRRALSLVATYWLKMTSMCGCSLPPPGSPTNRFCRSWSGMSVTPSPSQRSSNAIPPGGLSGTRFVPKFSVSFRLPWMNDDRD